MSQTSPGMSSTAVTSPLRVTTEPEQSIATRSGGPRIIEFDKQASEIVLLVVETDAGGKSVLLERGDYILDWYVDTPLELEEPSCLAMVYATSPGGSQQLLAETSVRIEAHDMAELTVTTEGAWTFDLSGDACRTWSLFVWHVPDGSAGE